jgi:hypothetical protein
MTTTTTTSPQPEQGQMVSVRSRNWMVTDISTCTLPPERLQTGLESPQHLITLSSVEDDGLGEELNVIWELEPGARVVEKVAPPEPTGLDSPDRLDAFLDVVRWGASSSADLRTIQAPFRSGIDIEDYQLDSVVREIQMPRVNNLLVADDVGLGQNHRNNDASTALAENPPKSRTPGLWAYAAADDGMCSNPSVVGVHTR